MMILRLFNNIRKDVLGIEQFQEARFKLASNYIESAGISGINNSPISYSYCL